MEPGVLLLPYNTPLVFPILSQINPGHATQSTVLTATLILSCHLIVSIRSGILPTGFPTKPHYKFFFPLYVLHHPSILGYPNHFSWKVSCSFLLCNICPVLFHFFFLTAGYFPQHYNTQTSSAYELPLMRQKFFTPACKNRQNYGYALILTWYIQVT